MINFMELGSTTFQDSIANGMEPGEAAQAAGQACMDAAADAGFPPDMIQACMDAGSQAFDDSMANGMSPGDCMTAAMQGGMDAGNDHFNGPDMPDIDAIAQTAFDDAMEGGAGPEVAGEAVSNAIMEAATEAGIPPEVVQAGLEAGGQAFQDALANGSSPQEAFDAAMDAGGNAADGVMTDAGFDMMDPEGMDVGNEGADMGPDGAPGDMAPEGPMGGQPSGEPVEGPMGGPAIDPATGMAPQPGEGPMGGPDGTTTGEPGGWGDGTAPSGEGGPMMPEFNQASGPEGGPPTTGPDIMEPSGPPPGEPGAPPPLEPGGPDMDSITQAMDAEADYPPMPDGPDMPEGGADGADLPPADDVGDEIV
jgi:hypothetical protein